MTTGQDADAQPRRRPCETRGCTKNAGHASEHRVPRTRPTPGRTLAQTLGHTLTCGVVLEVKDVRGVVDRHRCKKPKGLASTHHDGRRSWA